GLRATTIRLLAENFRDVFAGFPREIGPSRKKFDVSLSFSKKPRISPRFGIGPALQISGSRYGRAPVWPRKRPSLELAETDEPERMTHYSMWVRRQGTAPVTGPTNGTGNGAEWK